MILNCIFARDVNGKMNTESGELPWRTEPFCSNPEIMEFAKKDMAHFKEVTTGNIIIMGYNTFLTFKNPLPGRWNIVIDRNYKESDFRVLEQFLGRWIFFSSIESCLESLSELEKEFLDENKIFPKVYLIGGKKLIDYCKERSLINGIVDETIFPWKM